MNDLFTELLSVTAALDRAKISYALVGGLAFSIYVELRATEDIDLLIAGADWPAISELLKPLGYQPMAAPMNFANIQIRRLTKISGPDVLLLDFLLAEGDILEGLARKNAIPLRNQTIFVAPPEIIIKLKQGRLSDKDKSDIVGLTRILERGQ